MLTFFVARPFFCISYKKQNICACACVHMQPLHRAYQDTQLIRLWISYHDHNACTGREDRSEQILKNCNEKMIAKEERNQSNQKLDYWKLYIVTECKVKESCQEENAHRGITRGLLCLLYTLHIAHNGTQLHHIAAPCCT